MKDIWKPFLLSLFLIACELPLLYVYFEGTLNTLTALILHGVVILVPLYFLIRAYKRKKDIRYELLLFISVFALGPFGAVEYALITGCYLLFSLFSVPIDLWFAELFPLRKSTDFAEIFSRVKIHLDDYTQLGEVSSFFDILHIGSEEQKLGVLDLIAKDFNPAYSSILIQGLDDPSNSVRVQSAAIIQNIEARFEAELAQLLSQPLDPLKLAEYYDRCGVSGIFDPEQTREIEQFALHYYQDYLKGDPNNRIVWFSIGRLFYHLGLMNELILWSDEYRNRFGSFPGMAQSWYLEALYQLKRYDELQKQSTGGRSE